MREKKIHHHIGERQCFNLDVQAVLDLYLTVVTAPKPLGSGADAVQ
jgi:hypothetical protein